MASDDEHYVADSADEKAIQDPAPGGPKLSDRLCRTTIRVEAQVSDEGGRESVQYEEGADEDGDGDEDDEPPSKTLKKAVKKKKRAPARKWEREEQSSYAFWR
ncbi:hypothetical protein LZ554_002948 [Drepanopeziza brunnea f. sp. 'monogermtubi']|nr:hypothetical protein LZ554_002948 [Drepanopeziza brunnea f. sp. 'monogermtubi']